MVLEWFNVTRHTSQSYTASQALNVLRAGHSHPVPQNHDQHVSLQVIFAR
jgi:hypothetical protein